jgi:hypothetical protein
MPPSLLVATLVAGTIVTAGASPALAGLPPGCANPNDSALNQYCDSLPAASGGQTPKLGGPALSIGLSARVIRQIEFGRTTTHVPDAVRQSLLRLPAPTPARAGAATIAGADANAGGKADTSFPLGLIAVMAALAAVLIAAAFGRRRRSAPPSGPGSTSA